MTKTPTWLIKSFREQMIVAQLFAHTLNHSKKEPKIIRSHYIFTFRRTKTPSNTFLVLMAHLVVKLNIGWWTFAIVTKPHNDWDFKMHGSNVTVFDLQKGTKGWNGGLLCTHIKNLLHDEIEENLEKLSNVRN